MAKKLKPCPFCGGKAVAGINDCVSWRVRCDGCGAKIVVDLPEYTPLGCVTLKDVEEQALNEARAKWQKRTP